MLASLLAAAALSAPVPLGESHPAWAPDSVRLAYVRAYRPRERIPTRADIYASLLNGRPKRLTHGGGFNTSPAWSPDGRWIAFIRTSYDLARSRLMLMDRAGRRKRVLVGGVSTRASWSPDGRELAFVREQQLWRLDVVTGEARAVAAAYADWPAWSPDGELIAWGGRWPVCVVFVTYVASGRNEPREGLGCLFETVVGGPAWSPDGARIAFADCDVSISPLVCELVFASRIPYVSTWQHTKLRVGPHIAWSRDGRRLAFHCVRGFRAGLVVWNLDRRGLRPTC
jgi:Tol biopolymer transport system component